MRALAWLILVCLQDADRLVQQLGDDEIEARERAAQKLLELGPSARPALERAAKGTDVEIAGRARSILGEIALAENRRKVFGKVGRITLDESDYSLEKICKAVKEQTEIVLSVPNDLAGRRVKIGAKDELLWSFTDRLCLVHGNLRYAPRSPVDEIELEKGTSGRPPVYYSGPFRVCLERLRLEKRNPFEGGWERGSFVVDLAWPPNVKPMGEVQPGMLAVREIVGDDGKSLKINPDLGRLYSSGMSWSGRTRTHREFVAFEYPAAGVRRLTRIRGTADLVFPQKLETVVFEKPLAGGAASRSIGVFKASLQDVRTTGEGVSGVVKLSSPVEPQGAPGRAQRASLNDRFQAAGVILVDGQGKEHRGNPTSSMSSSMSDGDTTSEEIERGYLFPGATSAASLRFEFVTEYFEKVIDFEFKDVELP